MMSTELGNISGDFNKRLNELALDLGQNNHYAAFLHDCISREITLLKESINPDLGTSASDLLSEFVSHPLPLHDDRIMFLPMYLDSSDPVYPAEDRLLKEWISKDRAPSSHFRMAKEYYSQKESWIVQKIMSLSEEFVGGLLKISHEKGVPVPSLHNMYVLMTGIDDFITMPQHQALLPAYLLYPVSATLAEDQRDELLASVWKKILDLLVESYWVMLMVGLVDLLNVLGNFRTFGLEEARKYLIHTAVYSELERRIMCIGSRGDLRSYMKEEFPVFEGLLKSFQQFVVESARIAVKKDKRKVDYPLSPLDHTARMPKERYAQRKASDEPEDSSPETSDSSKKELDYTELDMLNPEEHLMRIEAIKEKWEKEGGKLSLDEWIDEQITKNVKGDDDDSDSRLKIKTYKEKEVVLSEVTVLQLFEQRMELQGLLMTHKLWGNPDKVIHYLFASVNNQSRTIVLNVFSTKLEARYGMSLSTWKRRLQDIQQGKIDIPPDPKRPSGVRHPNDLYESEIKDIQEDKGYKQRHKAKNHLTQNELIKKCQEAGLQLSRTSLRNKISHLVKENKIPVRKDGISNLFDEKDLPLIARELANLIKK